MATGRFVAPMDLQLVCDTLADLLGKQYNQEITITLTPKPEYADEIKKMEAERSGLA